MRLLRTGTLEMVEFTTAPFPPYAILSHAWGEPGTEVSYQDMNSPGMEAAIGKTGFQKLTGFCERAVQDEIDFAWIDTCCIDKTNYTELSESINSMYEWYRQSRVCYAYLEDVPSAIDGFGTRASRSFDPTKVFERSRWFTRGWTLQELIAPEVVEFLARDWTEVGTKASLAVELAHITGIDARVLNGADVSLCNVAERISWAASRKTTKVEDAAYCLLGIFGVNMPLIYGEGTKAFHRLQEAILKETEDYTILAWGMTVPDTPSLLHDRQMPNFSVPEAVEAVRNSEDLQTPSCPPLAAALSDFNVMQRQLWRYANMEQQISGPDIRNLADGLNYSPPAVTSRGVRLWVRVLDCTPTSCLAYTNCTIYGNIICIAMRQSLTRGGDVYSRIPVAKWGYLFLSPDCLPSFRLRRVYLEREDGRPDISGAVAPLLERWKPVELSVRGEGMQCFAGWDASLDGDLSRVHVLDFATDNPQVVRCMYKEQKPLIVILYPDSCEVVLCPDSRFLLSHDGLLKSSGEWDQSALWHIKAIASRQNTASRPRRDRARKGFDDLTLHVAYKRLGGGTVVRIEVTPNKGP